MKKNQWIIVAEFGAFAFLLATQPACKSDKGKADFKAPVTPASVGQDSCYLNGQTVTGATARACCESGVPRASLPSQCPQSPGFTGSKSAINGFAGNAIAGRAALSSADGMVGNSSTGGIGGSAATAADSLARQANRPTNSAATNLQETAAGSDVAAKLGSDSSRGGSGGGGGGGAMASGGGLGAFGAGISTQPAGSPTTAAAQAGPNDGPAYAGAGGGSRSGGGGGDMGSLFGSGGGAQGARGQDAMSLGRNPAGNSSGSQDPEDYFGMLKPSDNLFKIVERRYTEKAGNWARSDALQASEAVKKLVK